MDTAPDISREAATTTFTWFLADFHRHFFETALFARSKHVHSRTFGEILISIR